MAGVVVSLESVLTLQEKFNNSLQSGRTTIGRMVDMIPFPSNGENSAHGDSKLSSNAVAADKNMFLDTRAIPADFRIPNPSLKVFKFADLERATRNFSLDLLLGSGAFGRVFLGWVNHKTFAPSTRRVGFAVAVKRLEGRCQGLAEWQSFHVQCFHIPVWDRTPLEGLIQIVEEAVMIENASSQNKPIYLLEDSFGGSLALSRCS